MDLERLIPLKDCGPGSRRDSHRAPGRHAMETGREILILLVDDELSDTRATLEVLGKAGLARDVRVARGGQEAVDYLFGRGQFATRRRFPLPQLVLLDLHMPGTDGFAVLRQMRQAEALRGIPVIALCTSPEEGERALRCEFRANRYVVKPVTLESLGDTFRARSATGRSALTCRRRPTLRAAPSAPPARHARASRGTRSSARSRARPSAPAGGCRGPRARRPRRRRRGRHWPR